MEAPLHKLCGTRHWSGQPCPLNEKSLETTMVKALKSLPKTETRARPRSEAKKAGVVARKSAAPAKTPKSSVIRKEVMEAEIKAKRQPTQPKAKKPASAAPKRPPHRPRKTPEGFDKQKWQREYMRAYRERKKAEREAAERKAARAAKKAAK